MRAHFVLIVSLVISKNTIYHFNISKDTTNLKGVFMYTM